MSPILKTTLIVLGLLIVGIIAAFLHECRTWPRGEDEPDNDRDYDDL